MAAKSASSGKEKLIEEEEEVLQAVILADSFNKRFRPLTTRKPRCLLPICNAPLLDWTFESLALAGVQEVFVICRSHAELVKDAIKESKWSKPGSGMKIVPIMTAKETFSPGDAMRDIYTRGLVTSDFVLVMGDLVSNIRIDEVVRVHKERRKTNKDAIMTMVVKESGEKHRTRAQGESSVFVLDPETSECLHYEHIQGYPKTKGVNIPREILAAHPEVEIRNDLLDCSIDVCSVEVPSLFQDNFDYLDLRRDFVHGILTSDILMKNIYCYVAEEGYAARVQDTRSYESISKDILSRWTFPLVPDDNHPGGHIYEHTRGNRYIAKDNTVVLARTCNIGTNTLIGSSTIVGENTNITASVVGQNCRIGAGSTIRNSYIFENAVVGEGCTIERSIIGSGVHIKDYSKVPRGCLIAEGVVVGPNATLEPFERLSMRRSEEDVKADEEDDDSDIEEVEANQDSIDLAALGKDTNAIVWPRGAPADEDEDDESPENFKNQRFMRLGETLAELEVSDGELSSSDSGSDSDSDDSDAYGDMHDRDSLSGMSDLSMQLQPMDGKAGGLMADAEFRTEVTQSLERAFAENHSVENAAVELKTLRMASNVPLTRVKEAVIAAIVEKIPLVEGDPATQRKEIAAVVERWGELINLIGGIDPVETVSILQAHCASSTRMPLFGQILAALYQEDIVDEDDIRAWHAIPASKTGEDGVKRSAAELENMNKCWMIGAAMIQQFDAQASDSEDESEDDASKVEEKNPTPKTKSASAPALTDSSEDSDEEDEEESKPTPKIPAVAAPKFISAAASAESTDSDSDSEEEVLASASKGIEATSSKATAPVESTDESESEAEIPPQTKTSAAQSSQAFVPTVASSVESTDNESESDNKEIKSAVTAKAPTSTPAVNSTAMPSTSVPEVASTGTGSVAAEVETALARVSGSTSVESTDESAEEEGAKAKSTIPSTTQASAVVTPPSKLEIASAESTDNESEVELPTPSVVKVPAATVPSVLPPAVPSVLPPAAAKLAAPISAESTDESDSEPAPLSKLKGPAPASTSKLGSVETSTSTESTDDSDSDGEKESAAAASTSISTSKIPAPVYSESESEFEGVSAPKKSTEARRPRPRSATATIANTSLSAPRVAPAVLESSSDDNDASMSEDDGMSDAVSASDGTSSAAPSTNPSREASEDEGELSD